VKKRSKKKTKKGSNGPVFGVAIFLICFVIYGYWRTLKDAQTAEKTVLVFENDKDDVENTPRDVKQIGWKDLEGLDYLSGKMSESVRALDNRVIKLPGYMVPLTDNLEFFCEFLILPDPQACIHMPPPPPNQMLYVRATKDVPIKITSYAFWFEGKLELMPTNSTYGRVSYKLKLQPLYAFKRES
jgi:uncharacterized protein